MDIIEYRAVQTSIGNCARWHERFGHLNFTDLKKLQRNNMISGLNLNSKNANMNCVICVAGRIQQLPYKNSEHRRSEQLGHQILGNLRSHEHRISPRREILCNVHRRFFALHRNHNVSMAIRRSNSI